MRTQSVGGARVPVALIALAALVALAPGESFAQTPGGLAGDYAPPDNPIPLPLYSNRPDVGGFYMDGGYVMYQQTNPLQNQQVAVRGFIVSQNTFPSPDGSAATFQITDPATGSVAFQGQFLGSRNLALDTSQVATPAGFQPGFQIAAGWKFGDGSAITAGFMWMSESQYRATATLVNTPNINRSATSSKTRS